MAVVEAAGDTVSLMPSSREGNSSTPRWTSDRLSKHSSCRPHRRSRSSFVHRSVHALEGCTEAMSAMTTIGSTRCLRPFYTSQTL